MNRLKGKKFLQFFLPTIMKRKELIPLTNTNTNVSMAKNYFDPLTAQVNLRTGELSLTLNPPTLPGIQSMDINLGITYNQSDYSSENLLFGLPAGWSFGLSYILDNMIFINGSQSYVLNPGSDSGMQYYNQKNLVLNFYAQGKFPTLPYEDIEYAYMLSFLDGHNQYFDPNGKLICYDDRYGNHILYNYNLTDASIDKAQLIEVIGTYGESITLDFSKTSIHVVFPTNGTNKIDFLYQLSNDQLQITSYKDPLGDVVEITYNGGVVNTDLISKITYPTQRVTTYEYATIKYIEAGDTYNQDVISSVKDTYQQSTQEISYNYNGQGDYHNYMGYPSYDVASGIDALLESNDDEYMYYTIVNNGIEQITYKFNNLHLQLEKSVSTQKNEKIKELVTSYTGEKGNNQFPPYNQLPPNYQYPKEQNEKFYNNQNQTRKSTSKTTYNNAGQTEKIKTYEDDGKQLTKEILSVYDSNYGILISQMVSDYKPEGVITDIPFVTQINNSLTSDNKGISSREVGNYSNNEFNSEQTTSYEYDTNGRVISYTLAWTNPSQNEGIAQTSYTMQYTTSLSDGYYSQTKFDFNNNPTTEQYDISSGFLISKENALKNQVTYSYDGLGRKLTETSALGTMTKWSYDNQNNKVTVTYDNGYIKCYYFDGFNNNIKTTDIPKINGNERTLELKVYNDLGQLASRSTILGENSETLFTYDDQGQIASKTDALGNISSYVYDQVAKTKSIYFNGVKTQEQVLTEFKKIEQDTYFSLDDNATTIVSSKSYNALKLNTGIVIGEEGNGNWTSQSISYDTFKNPIQLETSGFDGIKQVSKTTRDLLNNILQSSESLSTSSGNVSSMRSSSLLNYDELGQLVEETTLLKQSNTYQYDAVGNNIKSTDFSGNVTSRTYDANNRLTSFTYAADNDKTGLVQYTYDNSLNVLISIEQSIDGKSTQVINYDYSVDGLLSKVTYPDGKTLAWSYDENNMLSSFVDATANSFTYTIDIYGRITKVVQVNTNTSIEVTYYSVDSKATSGQIESLTYSNGLIISYAYNGFNQIATLGISNTDKKNILTVIYSYDDTTNNVVGISSSSDVQNTLTSTINYTYNSLNQLISETKEDSSGNNISTTTYAYDASGNIITQSTTETSENTTSNYTYDDDNKLMSIETLGDTINLSYDTNGNLVDDGDGNTYTYNTLNQLTSYTNNNGDSTLYTYYPTGLRATKTINSGESITFYYDDAKNANIVNEIQGKESASYVMLNGNRYVRLYNDGTDTSADYLIQNTKDVLLVVNEQQQVIDNYSYTAYGENVDSSKQYSIKDNPFQYTREYVDIESGLYYLRSRYYNPKLMCFISRDNIVIFNHYAYANGNPIMNIDPSGHLSLLGTLFTIAAVAVGIALVVGGIVLIIVTGGTATPAVAAAETAAIEADADAAVAATAALDAAVTAAEAQTASTAALTDVASGITAEAAAEAANEATELSATAADEAAAAQNAAQVARAIANPTIQAAIITANATKALTGAALIATGFGILAGITFFDENSSKTSNSKQ